MFYGFPAFAENDYEGGWRITMRGLENYDRGTEKLQWGYYD